MHTGQGGPTRTAFVTAAAAGSVALLAATAALAVATHPAGTQGASRLLEALHGLTPPPGAAILFIAALLAARRGHR